MDSEEMVCGDHIYIEHGIPFWMVKMYHMQLNRWISSA